MLRCEAIGKSFGPVRALDRVDLHVAPGEVVGFVGRNGAGKTTTMRCIMGILSIDSGSVTWNGRPITDEHRNQFGYLPEERGLYPKMRCGEQLHYLSRLAGLSDRDAHQQVEQLLTGMGLDGRADDPVEKLSLGNQQRVQLAAALVGHPNMLILDEPFSGLDPVGVDVLTQQLLRQTASGVGLLFSSHQLDLLERVADRVVIIDSGRIVGDEPIVRRAPEAERVDSLAYRFRHLVGLGAAPGSDRVVNGGIEVEPEGERPIRLDSRGK
jgi:ABC-2 type transport system ATP-binding protein